MLVGCTQEVVLVLVIIMLLRPDHDLEGGKKCCAVCWYGTSAVPAVTAGALKSVSMFHVHICVRTCQVTFFESYGYVVRRS